MRMYDIILKKREGLELSDKEIKFFIEGYTSGLIPDYQAAALLMAIFFRGLNSAETALLTMSMASSGDYADLSQIPGIKVDKHSTGGVGDKTTLVLIPLVAAAGVPVAKMSGRGLGHTGGTVDKLEAIPGFRVELEMAAFIRQVKEVGAAVVAQTGHLVPVDKKLYALRDVTATVDSVPLIAASVMSKKIAAGADAIVLDVKTGGGAFMRDLDQALDLAGTMVGIGRQVGRRTVALVTDMDQPLGFAVGNALEVTEAINTLKGQGPPDLTELCLTLGSQMLYLSGRAASPEEGWKKLIELLRNGLALKKFEEIVSAQGGNTNVSTDGALLPRAAFQEKVKASADGFVQRINAERIGRAAMVLGAGRETKESSIDLSAGVVLSKKVGDRVNGGEPLAVLHANDSGKISEAAQVVRDAFSIGTLRPDKRPLVITSIS